LFVHRFGGQIKPAHPAVIIPNDRNFSVPLFEKEGLGEILLDKSLFEYLLIIIL